MTGELKDQRRARATLLALIAAGLAGLAAVTLLIDQRASRPEQTISPVVPGLAQRIGDAQRVVINSADANYRIERVRRGEQDVWVMRDRGDYPVAAQPLARLTEGLQNLETVRRMTNDPSKHERLGVGDPRQGGRGVLVQIEDANRALLVDLILGVEPDGGLYVRRPNEDQVWSVRGDLPPLRDAAAWMDLTPLDLAPEQFARAEIVPAEGRAYILERAEGGAFRLDTPALATSSPQQVESVATRLASIAPLDAQSAPAVQGATRARVRISTTDGVLIDAEIITAEDAPWLKLVARPAVAAPEGQQAAPQEAAALALNARMAEWAFRLSEAEAAALAPPLSQLLPAPSAPVQRAPVQRAPAAAPPVGP